MFTSIRTSKQNRELVTVLTKRLGLGAENIIARIAFSCSIAANRKMDLQKIKDAQGKEYTAKTLFGEYLDLYVAMICVHYDLYKTHKDIPRYIKMHIDDGLQLINDELARKNNMTSEEFIINKVEKGLKYLN